MILSQLSSPTCYVCNFFQLTIVRSNTLQCYIALVKGKCSKNVISLRHTVHWRVQICHKNMSVVYDIKKWFLLIYLLTAGRSESEPCYLYINALCRGAITKAATTEIMVKIGVMQHKQLLVIKKVVALGRNFSERK